MFAGNFQFLRENLFLFPAITVASLLQVLLATFTMLALSSLSKSSRYVAILYAGIIFFTAAIYRRAVRDHRELDAVVDVADRRAWRRSSTSSSALKPRYMTPWQVSLIVIVGADRGVDVDSRAPRPRRRGGDVSAAVTASATATPIVTADHVSKWYGQVIGLNDVSVKVPPGMTGLLGPNGAGKSTFMKLITGQLKPSKGTVTVLGEPIWGNPKLYFHIGFCPEQDAFYERMTGPRVGDGARAPQRPRREGGRRSGAARLDRRRSDGGGQQEDRRLQQGHAPARQARAGDRARSGAADPRRAASGMDPLARRRTIRLIREWARAGKSHHRLEPHPARDRVDDREHPADQQRPHPRRR